MKLVFELVAKVHRMLQLCMTELLTKSKIDSYLLEIQGKYKNP